MVSGNNFSQFWHQKASQFKQTKIPGATATAQQFSKSKWTKNNQLPKFTMVNKIYPLRNFRFDKQVSI